MSARLSTSIDPKLFETTADSRSNRFGVARASIKVWGLKSALSFLDQALTSGAGFAVNLFLARWLSASVYGAFAVVFAISLFVSGFHNVLVLEPLSVFGPAHHSSTLPAYFRMQVGIHFLLVGLISILGLISSFVLWLMIPLSPLTPALVAASVALPFFLLLWLVRRMCYVVRDPSVAVWGSLVYFAAILSGLIFLRRLGQLSPLWAFLLMGIASLIASLVLYLRLARSIKGTQEPPDFSLRSILMENWSYGRWLSGSALLFALSSQAQTLLAAGILGLSAAGIIRAVQIPSLLVTQAITAVGLLVLPTLSYDFGSGRNDQLRQKATLVSLGMGGASLCFAALLMIFASRAEHLLYGGKYAAYAALIPALALIPVFSSIGMGYSMALRASQKPHFDLISNACAAPIAILSAFFFMRWWGIAGAVASMVLSFAVLTVVIVICFQRQSTAMPTIKVNEDRESFERIEL